MRPNQLQRRRRDLAGGLIAEATALRTLAMELERRGKHLEAAVAWRFADVAVMMAVALLAESQPE